MNKTLSSSAFFLKSRFHSRTATAEAHLLSKFRGLRSPAYRSVGCGLLALILSVSVPERGLCAAEPLPKGAWTEPKEGYSVDSFTLGAGETRKGGFGNYAPNERRYFEEWLPALFERTLVVNAPTMNRGFRWIFTGDRSSLTIEHDGPDKTLGLDITFYDSPAFDQLEQKAKEKHPNLQVKKASFTLPDSEQPRALTVRLDQKQTLVVLADGVPIFTIPWFYTFTQHQVQLRQGKGPVAFRLLSPQSRKVNVSVDSSKTYQTMLGWGGIGTPTAYHELSDEGRRQWWRWVADYNLLFQREYPTGGQLNPAMDNWDRLNDAKAHGYGTNFPNGEVTNFAYNRAIQDLGGFVIFEFWDFPRWIGKSAENYAKAMLNYCETAKAKTGSAPFAVGIQNELEMKPELVEPFVTALRKGLDEKGLRGVKIHMANSPRITGARGRMTVYRDNPAVWEKIDFTASNVYDFEHHFSDLDKIDGMLRQWHDRAAGKPFLAVEWCINAREFQNDGYLVALSSGQSYQKLLTLTDASLISYCWTILNVTQPSYAMSRSLFAIDRANGFVPKPSSAQLRVYGAYSRHIQRGMIRSEAVSSDPDLMATAFKAENGRTTLVLVNRGPSPAEVKWTWPEAKPTTAELTDPYYQNQILAGVPKTSEPVIIPGGGIVTLSDVPLVSLPANFQVPQ